MVKAEKRRFRYKSTTLVSKASGRLHPRNGQQGRSQQKAKLQSPARGDNLELRGCLKQAARCANTGPTPPATQLSRTRLA
ncbi:hypothetical protein VTK26DRAFT_9193 [Humicola hyalothermophila]